MKYIALCDFVSRVVLFFASSLKHAHHPLHYLVCYLVWDDMVFMCIIFCMRFLIFQARFMTSVQGFLGKLGPKKGGGKKVSDKYRIVLLTELTLGLENN